MHSNQSGKLMELDDHIGAEIVGAQAFPISMRYAFTATFILLCVFNALLFVAALGLPLTIEKSNNKPLGETSPAFADAMFG